MREKPGGSAIFIPKFDPLALQKWRRGWDSNPRYGFPHARFRGECFQPLSHLSAVVADSIVAERCVFRQSGAYAVVTRKSGRAPFRPSRNLRSASLRMDKAGLHTDGILDLNDEWVSGVLRRKTGSRRRTHRLERR